MSEQHYGPIAWMYCQQGHWHFTDDKRDWYDAPGIETVIPLGNFDVIGELTKKRDDLQQGLQCFNEALDFAIKQGLDGIEFLRCWREGNWNGCREWGFPEEAIARVKEVQNEQ